MVNGSFYFGRSLPVCIRRISPPSVSVTRSPKFNERLVSARSQLVGGGGGYKTATDDVLQSVSEFNVEQRVDHVV